MFLNAAASNKKKRRKSYDLRERKKIISERIP